MKPIRSSRHLHHIRQMPCCLCAWPQSEPHHILRGVVRGTGMKAGDQYTIPLCSVHHRELHMDGNETQYLFDRGLRDPLGLANALWCFSADYVNMKRQIALHRKPAQVKPKQFGVFE